MGKPPKESAFPCSYHFRTVNIIEHHSQNYTFARIWKIIVFVIFHEMLSGLPYTLIWDHRHVELLPVFNQQPCLILLAIARIFKNPSDFGRHRSRQSVSKLLFFVFKTCF